MQETYFTQRKKEIEKWGCSEMAIIQISKICVLGSNPSTPAKIMGKIKIKEAKILMGIPVAIFSIEAYLSMITGYFLGNLGSPRMRSLVFTMGGYRFHLHHWIIGSVCLVLIFVYNFSLLPTNITLGLLGGWIFQGLCYDDWHQIITRKKPLDQKTEDIIL